MLTPLAPLWHFPAAIPGFITAYINGVAPDAYFNIFPYTNYLFFGAFAAHHLGQAFQITEWAPMVGALPPVPGAPSGTNPFVFGVSGFWM